MTDQDRYTLHVTEDKDGMRLDRFLTEEMSDMSRSRVKQLMDQGQISSDDVKKISASSKVLTGQTYVIDVPPVATADPEPQDIPIDVIYEDEHLLVLNKPVGLVVHPAAGNWDGTLVNALLYHCGDSLSGIGGVARPGIVHRLDKDTSGVMVVAKSDIAHRSLAGQFEAHSLERAYKAVVWGVPTPREDRIETLIGRSPNNRKKMAVIEIGGKYAATNYRVERVLGRAGSVLECRLETGRTHQIRVHMAHLGHSVVGDPVYGGGARQKLRLATSEIKKQVSAFQHQALHAYLIGFDHPVSGEFMRFTVDVSSEINELMDLLEKV